MEYNTEKKVGDLMIIGIVGGGASGMAAAIAASEEPDNHVILFERQSRVGKKLSATGNGRCNLSNIHACKKGFHGTDECFPTTALAQKALPVATSMLAQTTNIRLRLPKLG